MAFSTPIGITYTSTLGLTPGFNNDNTTALQTAINNASSAGKILYIDEQYGVNPGSGSSGILAVPSNTWIKFGPQGGLRCTPYSNNYFSVFFLNGVSNVQIEDAWIDVAAETNSIGSGEGGHGIGIYGGSDIWISNPDIRNTWGDGMYFDYACSNVTVMNAKIKNARRNGMSVISCNGLLIVCPEISETGNPSNLGVAGTNPMSGIDIEPDSNTDEIVQLRIISPRIHKSNAYGITVDLGSLDNTSTAVSVIISDPQDMDTLSQGAISWSNCTNLKTGYININWPRYIHDSGQLAPVNWDGTCAVTVTSPTSIG